MPKSELMTHKKSKHKEKVHYCKNHVKTNISTARRFPGLYAKIIRMNYINLQMRITYQIMNKWKKNILKQAGAELCQAQLI